MEDDAGVENAASPQQHSPLPHSPQPSLRRHTSIRYSDRFIPSRTGSDLATYALDLQSENASATRSASDREARPQRRRTSHCAHPVAVAAQDSSQAYTHLLRSHLLERELPAVGQDAACPPGSPVPMSPAERLRRSRSAGCVAGRETLDQATFPEILLRPPTPAPLTRRPPLAPRSTICPPQRNQLRFMSDCGGAGAPLDSPYSLSPLGGPLDGAEGLQRKPSRRIARSPFKARQLQVSPLAGSSRGRWFAAGVGRAAAGRRLLHEPG